MFKVTKKRILSIIMCLTMILSTQIGVVLAADSTGASEESGALKSGRYELTEESYPAEAMMKMPAIIEIDMQAKTFAITDNREGKEGAAKGSGNITFNEATGDYTLTYTADTAEGATSTITYADNAITFTSPMYFGIAKMNVVDEDGNFLSYTAKLIAGEGENEGEEEEEEQGEGTFKEGTYTGTLEKTAMGGSVTYDVTAAFFGGEYTYIVKINMTAMGGYSDAESHNGTYTVNGNKLALAGGKLTEAVVTGDGKLTLTGIISSFGSSEDSVELVWTSDQKPDVDIDTDDSNKDESEDDAVNDDATNNDTTNGDATNNDTTNNDAANNDTTKDDTVKGDASAESLKSGTYVLTEDSYDASAMMKIPAVITIDTDAMTFVITDNREATRGELKGSGTISFDKTTGIYTFTYTAGVKTEGVTSTVTYADNGITFTSPMYFGSAKMNVTDEDGNFIPYTAKLVSSEGSDIVSSSDASDSSYVIQEGANGTVAQGANASYRLRCNGSLEKFVALYIDGVLVDEANYTKSSGSTVIDISADYMKTLAAGTHTIRLVYTDGSVETTLTVREVSVGEKASSPKTGDTLPSIVLLSIVSAGSLAVICVLRKRRRSVESE